MAVVISIYKKGGRSSCANYREISLLNTGYKVYTRMINNRLKNITNAERTEKQKGFRKGDLAVIKLMSKKAFDTVNLLWKDEVIQNI